jgi:DNA-binding GntR family transcriptional regulator
MIIFTDLWQYVRFDLFGGRDATYLWVDFPRVALKMSKDRSIDPKPPVHEIVYRRLRDMILFGELAPGQPVTIQGLVVALDSGVTPVREAIRRLTAERALNATDNRRVSVPELNKAQLVELSFARQHIEPHLAQLASARITPRLIDRLEEIDDALGDAINAGDVQAYLKLNYRFHRLLYEQANSDILISIADALWLRVGPSLRVVCGRYGTLNLPDMHEEAIASMRVGDHLGTFEAIRQDIEQGHSQILRTFDTS